MDVPQATPTSPREESATSLIFSRDAENPAVCVVDGYGIKVTTRSGRLVVSDGIGRQRRERTYNRATHGLSRLVVMATTGHITVEAYRWLDQLGIGLAMLDPTTGDVTLATARVANDDARLRRAQALAMGTRTGLDIAKYLIGLKLTGQAAVTRQELTSPEAAETIDQLARSVEHSPSLEEVRQLEASAANLYWFAWGQVEARFVKSDTPRVPENWHRFEGRRSAVTPGTARNATDPINALLNFSYRLVEAEGHLATLAVGMDPGMGILHADLKRRTSFVLDLIEAVRPLADLHVLRLVRAHPLRWRDFHEDARGVVRVLSPLTHRLAEGMPGYADLLRARHRTSGAHAGGGQSLRRGDSLHPHQGEAQGCSPSAGASDRRCTRCPRTCTCRHVPTQEESPKALGRTRTCPPASHMQGVWGRFGPRTGPAPQTGCILPLMPGRPAQEGRGHLGGAFGPHPI